MKPGTSDEISIREYVDLRFAEAEKAVQAALIAQKEAVSAALAAADRAVAKAETASDKRLESMNEFRSALSDSSRLQMPRSEAEQAFKTMNEKIEMLTARVNAREEQGRGLNQGWVTLVGLIATIGVIYALLNK